MKKIISNYEIVYVRQCMKNKTNFKKYTLVLNGIE